MNAFLSLADTGKNALWRYVVGTVLIVALWLFGSVFAGVLPLALGLVNPEAGMESMGKSPLVLGLSLLSFLPLLLVPFFVTVVFHRRPAGTLFGVARRVNWGRFGLSFALWGALYTLVAGVSTALGISEYKLNPNFAQTLPMVLVGLALLPIQTSAEEVFFRGYLLQATGRLVRSPILLAAINGVLFTLPHLANPEVQRGLLLASGQWFTFGFAFTLLTLRTGALDAALGVHAANNIVAFTLFGYSGGALPAVALFVTDNPDPAFGLVALVITLTITVLVLGRQQAAPAPSPALQS